MRGYERVCEGMREYERESRREYYIDTDGITSPSQSYLADRVGTCPGPSPRLSSTTSHPLGELSSSLLQSSPPPVISRTQCGHTCRGGMNDIHAS
jgi:hypothetical protein